MENEKNIRREQTDAAHDSRQPRRKGYFITPVSEEGKRQGAPNSDNKPSAPRESGEDGRQGQKSASRSRRRRGHGNRQQKPSDNNTAPNTPVQDGNPNTREIKKPNQPNAQQTSDGKKQEKNPMPKEGEGRSRSRRSRKKKHNNHKEAAKDIAQTPEVASSVATPAPTSVSRPQTRPDVRLKMTLDDEPTKAAMPEVDDEPIDPAQLSPDVLESPPSMSAPDESIPRVEVVGIRFKSSGKIYYFDPTQKKYAKGSSAIVETARGLEYGEVALANTRVRESDVVLPLRPVIRAATDADIARHNENTKKEKEAFRVCTQKIQEHKLEMKLIDAQYTFDNSKLLFYFTSADRVDFRELVKDLAGAFRTRIELRQIGIRDEAKMMGGLGMCGRPLCCSVFLSDFCQVSIKMAKEQNFSLNSSKISGICGRLMCCLRYEHETYEYEIKRTPPVHALVETPDGNGVVIENSPLAGTVKVRLSVTPEVAPKVYRREDVTVLQKKAPNPNNHSSQDNRNGKSK